MGLVKVRRCGYSEGEEVGLVKVRWGEEVVLVTSPTES